MNGFSVVPAATKTRQNDEKCIQTKGNDYIKNYLI